MDYMTLKEAKADWLIGINATRLFSILYHKTLNVGRVQTPTLAMPVSYTHLAGTSECFCLRC